MATFNDYSAKQGAYLVVDFDFRTQTLQVDVSAENFLRQWYGDESFVPNNLVRVLIALGDVHSKRGGPDAEELLSRMPTVSPEDSKLTATKRSELEDYVEQRLTDRGLSREKFDRLNRVLDEETRLDPIEWSDEYEWDNSTLHDIADKYFDE